MKADNLGSHLVGDSGSGFYLALALIDAFCVTNLKYIEISNFSMVFEEGIELLEKGTIKTLTINVLLLYKKESPKICIP